MLSDWETQQGGAAIAASRLAAALERQGKPVTRVVFAPDGKPHPWKSLHLAAPRWAWGMQRVSPPAFGSLWVRRKVQAELGRILTQLKPDLINLHNLHGSEPAGGGFSLVEICARHAPVVWTLHDMWSFTGRCAYNQECQLFIQGCDARCPTPDVYPSLAPNRIAPAWERRRRFFDSRPDICAVAPSAWLAHQAKTGFWKQSRVEVIPNGLPVDVYQPFDQQASRFLLGLPERGTLLLAAAADLGEPRKGLDLLMFALRQVARSDLTLVLMGKPVSFPERQGFSVVDLGYLTEENRKAAAYSAADLFVHPAREDNLPNTVVEALACGTPVVAFPVGGLTELVRPGVSGHLAAEVSSPALARAMDSALDEIQAGKLLRSNCRRIAVQEYADTLQADRYLALFDEMVTH